MDLHTARAERVVLLALCSVLTLANWHINKASRGMRWFGGYIGSLVVGAIFIALRGQIPDFYSFTLSNLLFISAYVMLYIAVVELIGQTESQLPFLISSVTVAAIVLLIYEASHSATKSRTIAFCLLLAFEEALVAFLLYYRKPALLRIAGLPMIVMLSGISLTNSALVIGAFLRGPLAAYFATSSFLAGVISVSSALQCGTVVAYIWLTTSLLRQDLEKQASTDPLTGLLNRRAMERLAPHALGFERRVAAPASLLLMDLDGFKQINDTYGHGCGDKTLTMVAERLRGTLRQSDLIARLGGDEFAVLLPSTPLEAAYTLAEQLRLAIASMEISWANHSAQVTTSIGLSEAPLSLAGWDHLVTRCDHAMYAAKKKGGNRIVVGAGSLADDVVQFQAIPLSAV